MAVPAARSTKPHEASNEVEGYLRCGLLEHGCVRLRCEGCDEEIVVAFSCKARGFCPSCVARRMADVATHLVDEVLPEVPVRQWVCTLPAHRTFKPRIRATRPQAIVLTLPAFGRFLAIALLD